MATVRFPAAVIVPGALVAALVLGPSVTSSDDAGRTATDAGGAVADAPLAPVPDAEMVAVAAPAGARGSTWFCAPGTATGAEDGFAEHLVVIANAGDGAAGVTLTVVPDEGEPVVEELEVPAASRVAIELSELVTAEWAAALVETDRGEVAVDHLLRGPTGTALDACATTPTDRAWFPSGATEDGAREVLAIYNPFPDEAVISVSFETEQGARTPEDLEARVVPPRSAVAIELGDRVAVRREVATTVEVVAGQIVVDRIQSFDGSAGRTGLSVTPAAPRPAAEWWFPAAEVASGQVETVVIQNPDRERVATVDVAAVVEGRRPDEQPEPFAVEVAPGRYLTVPLDRDGRIPAETPVSVVVRALDDHPVVAELVTTAAGDGGSTDGEGASEGETGEGETSEGETGEGETGEGERATPTAGGLSSVLGSPVAAPRWIAPLGSFGGADVAVLSVANPGRAAVRVSVTGLGEGRRGEAVGAVEVPAGGRVDLDVAGGAGFHPAAFDVRADGPVVVSRRFVFGDGRRTDALAVPVADGVESVRGLGSG